MIYEVSFRKKAEKFLEKQTYSSKIRILTAIGHLPQTGDIKKMQGFKNLYRLRVGDFRILYEMSEKTQQITLIDVTDIDSRGQIYK